MKDAKEAAKAMSDFVNNMSCDQKAFIEEMANQHRTLQQSFTSLCFAWIRQCSKQFEDKNFDLRNEWSCKVSNEILKKIEDVEYNAPFIQEK